MGGFRGADLVAWLRELPVNERDAAFELLLGIDENNPAQRPLGVVTKGAPKGALRRFLRWVATSRKAREVIATRYIPRS